MNITQRGQDTDFHFRTRGMNGLTRLRLWRTDTKEVLWEVSLNYYRGSHLRYGDIPKGFRSFNGNLRDAKQIYPVGKQRPLALPRSTAFMVELDYQYDDFLAPSTGDAYFSFATDGKGAISKVTRLEQFPVDSLPKAQ